MARALEEGRSVGIGQSTSQILEIRGLKQAGYRFEPDDLTHWQWRALVAVDQAIEEHRAQELERARNRSAKIHH
jgi:hypothetical protein